MSRRKAAAIQVQHRCDYRHHAGESEEDSGSRFVLIETFAGYRKDIVENLDQIEKFLIGYYASVVEQIKLKNSDPHVEIKNAE